MQSVLILEPDSTQKLNLKVTIQLQFFHLEVLLWVQNRAQSHSLGLHMTHHHNLDKRQSDHQEKEQ